MQVRVRGLGSHARHARNRLARATPRPTGGDGDGPLADGRTPVECRTHCASSTGRQRCLARVEPVGRGGTNGGGVALRPPFTPRRSPQRARNETARTVICDTYNSALKKRNGNPPRMWSNTSKIGFATIYDTFRTWGFSLVLYTRMGFSINHPAGQSMRSR